MKQVNAEATSTLNQMIGMMDGWAIKIDNSNNAFMPVFISTTYEDSCSKIFTVGQYYSEEVDIIAEPEMQFLYDESAGSYYPIYYRQDSLEIENFSAKIDDGFIINVNKLLQAEHVEFANGWLRKIKKQQNL